MHNTKKSLFFGVFFVTKDPGRSGTFSAISYFTQKGIVNKKFFRIAFVSFCLVAQLCDNGYYAQCCGLASSNDTKKAVNESLPLPNETAAQSAVRFILSDNASALNNFLVGLDNKTRNTLLTKKITYNNKKVFDFFSLAATLDKHKSIKVLAQHKCNINVIGDDGHTPATGAVSRNSMQTLELLIQLGADLEAIDGNDRNALGLAI